MNTPNIMRIRPFLDNFSNVAIGHERLFEEMINQFSNGSLSKSSYPPHNLIKETEEKYRIEIAVAGFSKDEILVKTQEDKLIIKSIPKLPFENEEEKSKDIIVYKGIAERDFVKSFHLSEDVVVTDASFNNGVIIINLERIIPEEKKPKIFNL